MRHFRRRHDCSLLSLQPIRPRHESMRRWSSRCLTRVSVRSRLMRFLHALVDTAQPWQSRDESDECRQSPKVSMSSDFSARATFLLCKSRWFRNATTCCVFVVILSVYECKRSAKRVFMKTFTNSQNAVTLLTVWSSILLRFKLNWMRENLNLIIRKSLARKK